MIDGVVITPLAQIRDERGKVMHMMSVKSKVFKKFGEIYFSCVYPGIVKGWHLHKKMILNYAVPYGKIKLVLYDPRKESKTKGQFMEIFLDPDNYQLVTVPPGVWNGFRGLGTQMSIVANCASIPHDPAEIVRIPSDDPGIGYDWSI
ncbi:MAG: dTDP-4-dehydrorhamnose 3,5-epimerase [Candidatus Nealsonbacteria bacterium RIFOXYC1_FULL_40_7]|uniref:dTDP-4-dehydrorhamnose 3,5-epimerase n=1 Tax=Candidatus Nealsonbacteria bacterium RIFOXYC1_FULL_40_7 TaxID=1801678 RepID=A0A1G2ETA3_9BACT|nr:MAG: dTDP-4-dehydrorhamnose 3,5-epimerase [Candidatus Nealsonbacteria bacterium RIFOXYC1_FULL_40_7]